MTLRRRLTCLLIAFAAFAVVSTCAAIYGIKWHVSRAVAGFQDNVDRTRELSRLRGRLEEQTIQLREILDKRRSVSDAYHRTKREFFDLLRQHDVAADSLATAFDQFHEWIAAGEFERAEALLSSTIESELTPATTMRLRELERRLQQNREHAVTDITATTTNALLLVTLVGAVGAGLVTAGAALIRRWLLRPLSLLLQGTEQFRRERFAARVNLQRRDELGSLAKSLNSMAESIADAQSKLRMSESKHRQLFENLRDAVVICDDRGMILECHDVDAGLLGPNHDQAKNQHLTDAWPRWRNVSIDWNKTVHQVIETGRQFRAVDLEMPSAGGTTRFVDFMIYRIECGAQRQAVIVLRDVTDRNELQERLRQAEVMKATGTLASGMAHDVNSLLTNAIGGMSIAERDARQPEIKHRLQSALRVCWQAAGLTRRLLNFAGGAQGRPHVIDLGETVGLMTDSLDNTSNPAVIIHTRLESGIRVRIDQDQLTQAVLNLIQNAKDAMPDGGSLDVWVRRETRSQGRNGDGPRACGVLEVRDSGCGMSAEVQKRMYEPFFTTKPRDTHRGRGLGMAMVYSAVRGASGSIDVQSRIGEGSVVTVRFPATDTNEDPVEETGQSET